MYNRSSLRDLHHARIDPQGTLITGDKGAGKSIIEDALMALLLPPGKALFNVPAAQDDRTDRRSAAGCCASSRNSTCTSI